MAASDLSRGEEVGRSAFARVTAMIYCFIILELVFLVAISPSLVAIFFLSPEFNNLPLFIICALPVGPALSGVVFALRRRSLEGPDLSPAAHFWRGYRLNFKDVLRWWAPFLILCALGSFVAINLSLTFLPDSAVWVFIALGVLAALWAGHMLILTSAFSFRTRDAARLAGYFFFRCFPATLVYLSLLVVCFALTYLVSMWVPIIVASLLSAMYVRASTSTMDITTEQFTAHEEDAATDEPTDEATDERH